jgi:small-conductance mechanosensitive channel
MNEFLDFVLINIGGFKIQVIDGLKLGVFLILVIGLLFILKRIIYRSTKINEAKKYSIFNLSRYFISVLAILMALQIIGFNLSLLLAGSAALLVGLGLGIQNLFSDYVSGLIILFDSTLKVGDVIEINGIVCKVQEIHLRTTLVFTREDKYIILPNTELTRNLLINWTHNSLAARFDVKVGVSYQSDINLVKSSLLASLENCSSVLAQPKPFVRMLNHGDSSLEFGVYFFTNEVFRVEQIKSEIRENITRLFRENKIEIPFPQRVIHTINT